MSPANRRHLEAETRLVFTFTVHTVEEFAFSLFALIFAEKHSRSNSYMMVRFVRALVHWKGVGRGTWAVLLIYCRSSPEPNKVNEWRQIYWNYYYYYYY